MLYARKDRICQILGHSFKYLKPWFICERCGYHVHNYAAYPPQGCVPPPGVIDHNFLINVTANQHHNEVHGAAQHTDVTRELFLPAYGAITSTYFSANPGHAVNLPNNADNNAEFSAKVPDDFVSFVSVKAVWACDDVAIGNMRWSLRGAYPQAGEVYYANDENPGLGQTATGGTSILNVQEPANPLTLIGLQKGDYLFLRFVRNATHVDDTLEGTAYLFGLLFTYVAEQ